MVRSRRATRLPGDNFTGTRRTQTRRRKILIARRHADDSRVIHFNAYNAIPGRIFCFLFFVFFSLDYSVRALDSIWVMSAPLTTS